MKTRISIAWAIFPLEGFSLMRDFHRCLKRARGLVRALRPHEGFGAFWGIFEHFLGIFGLIYDTLPLSRFWLSPQVLRVGCPLCCSPLKPIFPSNRPYARCSFISATLSRFRLGSPFACFACFRNVFTCSLELLCTVSNRLLYNGAASRKACENK